jgi:hypothetical protein
MGMAAAQGRFTTHPQQEHESMAKKPDVEPQAAQPLELKQALSLPDGFRITEVPVVGGRTPTVTAPPNLGPLAAFTGTFEGRGFNTIFRPDSTATPTALPTPVAGSDNILELNLTSETLSFSRSLGAVPNRGSGAQADAFLNGVPYLQSITDVTIPSQPTGIHLEPGLWMIVPATTAPAEGVTLVRMASIPHGTTIEAQGTSSTASGPPNIPAVDITPFATATPHEKITFPSQTATNGGTARIPQDLTSFIAAGTITQAILADPNTVLRDHIAGQKIASTATISISTNAPLPLFGGGADNIAFLQGDPAAATPNAQTVNMQATFWIETVEHTIVVPPFKPGQPPLTLKPELSKAGSGPVPTFTLEPPIEITAPRRITVFSTQIQYSQVVFLNFNKLTWPHVSVATLVPAGSVPVPPSVWT